MKFHWTNKQPIVEHGRGGIFYCSSHRTGQTQMAEILKSGMWNFKEGFLKKNSGRTYRMA